MRRYLELGSVQGLLEDLKASGITTKRRQLKSGRVVGGQPFVRGPLYHFLKNRIYVGEIPHREKSYPGEHEAIVDRALFDQVQARLASNGVERASGKGAAHPSLLTGMIRDGHGRPMSPSHATKGKQRYRYYVSNEAIPTDGSSPAPAMRLPAAELERAVVDAVAITMEQAQPVRDRWTMMEARAARHAEQHCRKLAAGLRQQSDDARSLLRKLDLQILVEEHQITATCSLHQFLRLAHVDDPSVHLTERLAIIIHTHVRRRGQELRLRFDVPSNKVPKRDPQLIALMVKAFDARRKLADLDERSSRDERRELGRLARLSYLAPDIIDAIIKGRHPEDLTPRQLIRTTALPLAWDEQRRILGFA
jgi:hypothetical protein